MIFALAKRSLNKLNTELVDVNGHFILGATPYILPFEQLKRYTAMQLAAHQNSRLEQYFRASVFRMFSFAVRGRNERNATAYEN